MASESCSAGDAAETPASMTLPGEAEVKKTLRAQFSTMCVDYGGPQQFLNSTLPNMDALKAYGAKLRQHFPLDPSVLYELQAAIPTEAEDAVVTRAPAIVTLDALSFSRQATTKMEPDASTCTQILEEILADGFVTSTEPLFVRQPATLNCQELLHEDLQAWASQDNVEQPLSQFSIAMVKGMARTCTMHAAVKLLLDADVDIRTSLPLLWQSARQIHVRAIQVADEDAVTLYNLKMGSRGNIRKLASVVTWLGVILRQREVNKDKDIKAFIARHNEEASKNDVVRGAKLMAILQLSDGLSDKNVRALLSCVSQLGWGGCPFSEDSVSSKRILPGYTAKVPNRAYQERLRISEESFSMMVQNLTNAQKKKMWLLRTKLPKQVLEEKASTAALVYNIGLEVLQAHPITRELLDKHLFRPFIGGDTNVETEFTACVLEKPEDLKITDFTAVRKIIEEHNKDAQHTDPLRVAKMRVEAGQLEQQTFDLERSQMLYDLELIKTYLQKSSDRQTETYHKKLNWRIDVKRAQREFADAWTKDRVVFLDVASSEGEAVLFQGFLKAVANMQSAAHVDNIATLVLGNWAAPCTMSTQLQNATASLTGLVLNASEDNIALLAEPMFSYRRGLLWVTIAEVYKLWSSNRFNFDFPVKVGRRMDNWKTEQEYGHRNMKSSGIKQSITKIRNRKNKRKCRKTKNRRVLKRQMQTRGGRRGI